MTSAEVKRIARECGFELAGVTAASPNPDFTRYQAWVDRGMAGAMGYLTDRRGGIRSDPRNLLAPVRSIICVGKLYNAPQPYSPSFAGDELGWISRYAWGDDYHAILRRGLDELAGRLGPHEYKICVDTAPLLERSYARDAGLGWIGKNTCLINQAAGSWFFLGELLTSLRLEPDGRADGRCGTCTRCIDACPTAAIIPAEDGTWVLNAERCISYFTIELRAAIPEEHRAGVGRNIFGCDICQDVCPWNTRAAVTLEPAFGPHGDCPPSLARLAALTPEQFAELFRYSPVARAKYVGFLRNIAVAMGNSGRPEFREPLRRLASYENEIVAEHAKWALGRLDSETPTPATESYKVEV